ncbi:MAG: hypothetical protein NZ898_08810 [Myxococcota bacterium]|nr:hypothetical protein [Myxococcota bacterium]
MNVPTVEPGEIAYGEPSPFGRVVAALRHPLRILAMAGAALAVGWGLSVGEAMAAACVGATTGVVAGELMARSRLRPLVAAGGVAFVALLLAWLGSLPTRSEAVATALGPGTALVVSAVLRHFAIAFGLVAAMRTLAVRYPALMALELLLVVVAIAAPFAAHRQGVIARPLWLSDWAWRHGIDPADVFLAIGAGAAVLLALLLLLEQRGAVSFGALVVLPLLALLGMTILEVAGRPGPDPGENIGLTTPDAGLQPPRDVPGDPGRGPNRGDAGQGDRPGGDAGQAGSGADGGGSGAGRDAGQGGAGTDGGDGGGQGRGLDGGGQGGGDGGGGGAGGDAGRDGGVGRGLDGGGQGAGDGGAEGGAGQDGGATWHVPSDGSGQGTSQDNSQQQPSDSNQSPRESTSRGSPAPLAVVVFDNDYDPPSETYYFRQEAWSRWNGFRLVPSDVPGTDQDTLDRFPTERVDLPPPPARDRVRVSGRVAVLVEQHYPMALETATAFAPMPNPDPERFVVAYRFESLAQRVPYEQLLQRPVGDPSWPEPVREMYLQRHGDPRFADLVREALAAIPPPMREYPVARAIAIKLWLDRNLIYSTAERHEGAPDPVVALLWGNRTGYCVHFAHAAALLFREAGIPARVSAGFMAAAERRRGGSSLMLVGSDAHAWPELYVRDLGWVVLDVTPERNLDQPGQPPDEDLQRMLGEMARDLPPDPADEVRDETRESPWPALGRLLASLLALAFAAAMALLYAAKIWRRLAPLWARGRTMPLVGYRAALDRLADAGYRRRYGETREQFAARVGNVAPSFVELTAWHVAAAMRDPATPPPRPEHDRTGWRTLLARTRREIRRAVPWWRRWLGALHPTSFLQTR